jgi:D-ribose pyranase
MAKEFLEQNDAAVRRPFDQALARVDITHEPHADFKRRVPQAVGLIRTADTIAYANVIVESG